MCTLSVFLFQISHSPSKDVDLTVAGGPWVYKGTRVKGTLNIFGYEIRANVKVSEDVSRNERKMNCFFILNCFLF